MHSLANWLKIRGCVFACLLIIRLVILHLAVFCVFVLIIARDASNNSSIIMLAFVGDGDEQSVQKITTYVTKLVCGLQMWR